MKTLILLGSTREKGNTAALLSPFTQELSAQGAAWELVRLADKHILPCVACRSCQTDWTAPGCCRRDDMREIYDKVLLCDLLVLATPIYSWYCTPSLKAVLDRLVYGLNKYYGERKGPSLWAGKSVALVTTCGYRPEQGADLWEEGVKRYCKHSQLRYAGMLAERHLGYGTVFMDEEKAEHARAFARRLCGQA